MWCFEDGNMWCFEDDEEMSLLEGLNCNFIRYGSEL